MQFVYKPEGAVPKKWDFDPSKLMSPEAEAIERHTKMTYGEWADAVDRGSILALHGLLFVMLKREQPTLKWDEVQFSISEVGLEFSDEETAEQIANLERHFVDVAPTDADLELLASLKAQLAEGADPVGDDEVEVPKED